MVPSAIPRNRRSARSPGLLSAGDTIIDGGNIQLPRRCAARARLAAKRLDYVDAGTSGGIWGLQEGYCLMVGGKPEVCTRLEADLSDAGADRRISARQAITAPATT
jgi:6-phosphogluconate dehydrogenase